VKYITKPNEWFDEGTEAVPVTGFWDCYNENGELVGAAVFRGIRKGEVDEEVCCEDEFEMVEEKTDE